MKRLTKLAANEFSALYGTRYDYLLEIAKECAEREAVDYHNLTPDQVMEKSLNGARVVANILSAGVPEYESPADAPSHWMTLVRDDLPVHFFAKDGTWCAEYTEYYGHTVEGCWLFFITFTIRDEDTKPLDARYFGAAA